MGTPIPAVIPASCWSFSYWQLPPLPRTKESPLHGLLLLQSLLALVQAVELLRASPQRSYFHKVDLKIFASNSQIETASSGDLEFLTVLLLVLRVAASIFLPIVRRFRRLRPRLSSPHGSEPRLMDVLLPVGLRQPDSSSTKIRMTPGAVLPSV